MFLAALAHAADPTEPELRGGEEIEVRQVLTPAEARELVIQALAAEGYERTGRRGDFTEFESAEAWKPDVLLHDDGWILVGWGRHSKPVEAVKARIYTATQDSVRALNDAVAADAQHYRLAQEIPAELQAIWQSGYPAAERHRLLFRWWDDRTDTPEGDAARVVAERFLVRVVQASDEPITPEELDRLNASRRARHPLELP